MKRKQLLYIFLKICIPLILVLIGGFFIFQQIIASRIRKEVLEFFEKNLEFCQIVKEKIKLNYGEFWMMCNNRPFFATYNRGRIETELNGWGWLKDTEYWDQLEKCDFYDFRNSKLIFYCPEIEETYPYFWKKAGAKIYLFDKNNFSLRILEEKDFFELVTEDMKKSYEILKGCQLSKLEAKGGRGYKPILFFEFQCDNLKFLTETNLHFSFPPIDFNNPEESLRKVFPEIKNVSVKENEVCGEFLDSTLCLSPRMTMKIKSNVDVDSTVREWLSLIFPKKELGELKFLKEKEFTTAEALPGEMAGLKFRYYKAGDEVIKVYFSNQIIFGLERVEKGFYKYESF